VSNTQEVLVNNTQEVLVSNTQEVLVNNTQNNNRLVFYFQPHWESNLVLSRFSKLTLTLPSSLSSSLLQLDKPAITFTHHLCCCCLLLRSWCCSFSCWLFVVYVCALQRIAYFAAYYCCSCCSRSDGVVPTHSLTYKENKQQAARHPSIHLSLSYTRQERVEID
jgi:hypothetical protein